MTLQTIAVAYQDATGCSDADAIEAAFVAAGLLADLVGDKKTGDYFWKHAREQGPHVSGAASYKTELVDTSYSDSKNWGWY